jgi:hypothetical protein
MFEILSIEQQLKEAKEALTAQNAAKVARRKS